VLTLLVLPLLAMRGAAAEDPRPKDLYPILKNKREGFINLAGEKVIKPAFFHIFGFAEGLSPVWVENGGKTGRYLVKPIYDCGWNSPPLFADGMAAVRIGEKWGYLDAQGKLVIPPQFVGALPFHDGLGMVVFPGGQTGWIDKTGAAVWKSAPPLQEPVTTSAP